MYMFSNNKNMNENVPVTFRLIPHTYPNALLLRIQALIISCGLRKLKRCTDANYVIWLSKAWTIAIKTVCFIYSVYVLAVECDRLGNMSWCGLRP